MYKINRKSFMLAAIAGTIAANTSAGANESWDMAIAYPASNYHSEVAESFANEIKDLTNGQIEITIHSGGSLYSGNEIYTGTRRGLIQVGERLISALETQDPLFGLDSLPFLATSFEDSKALYKASKPELEERLNEDGLKLLYSIPWPPQGLYTNKKISNIEDMSGIRFRAYSPGTERMAELMGAIPTAIEAADVTQAFSTGVAEAMFSSGSTGYDTKLWEHIDYWYDTQAWLPRGMVFINLRTWNSLTDEAKEAIASASSNAEKAGWERAEELADWYKEQLASEGMSILEPGNELKTEFEELGEDIVSDWKAKMGERGETILERYESMRD